MKLPAGCVVKWLTCSASLSKTHKAAHLQHAEAEFGAGAAPKSSGYRVVVTGLPKSASWQDLKDHFRRAGEVTFTQVPGLLGILRKLSGSACGC